MAQKKANAIVAEVAALPPMPPQLWQVSDAAAEFARFSAHKSSYGTLTAAFRDFNLCHSVANLVRDQLGYGYERMPGVRLERLYGSRIGEKSSRITARSPASLDPSTAVCHRKGLRAGFVGTFPRWKSRRRSTSHSVAG